MDVCLMQTNTMISLLSCSFSFPFSLQRKFGLIKSQFILESQSLITIQNLYLCCLIYILIIHTVFHLHLNYDDAQIIVSTMWQIICMVRSSKRDMQEKLRQDMKKHNLDSSSILIGVFFYLGRIQTTFQFFKNLVFSFSQCKGLLLFCQDFDLTEDSRVYLISCDLFSLRPTQLLTWTKGRRRWRTTMRTLQWFYQMMRYRTRSNMKRHGWQENVVG